MASQHLVHVHKEPDPLHYTQLAARRTECRRLTNCNFLSKLNLCYSHKTGRLLTCRYSSYASFELSEGHPIERVQ